MDLGTDLIAIVSSKDSRVSEIRKREPVVGQILDSFYDNLGKRYHPAVMILRPDAPAKVRGSEEAIVAFRNAVALSVILGGRAADARGYGGVSPTWSDTFDFHPAQVSRTGRYVVLSPALRSVVARSEPLSFTPSPYLPLEGERIYPDAFLYRALGLEWQRRFVRSSRDQFARSLFRSLEVAYSASAIGAKNQESVHDYGLQVAQWVSAIEILAWPAKQHANLERVLELLQKAPLHPRLRWRRYRTKLRRDKPPRRMNALERGYTYLHRARNSFLHGNPVSYSSLLTRGRSPAPIPRIAAIVYRAALVSYLSERYPAEINTLEELFSRKSEIGLDMTYNGALAELFGIDLG
jgi:hypothetical protein